MPRDDLDILILEELERALIKERADAQAIVRDKSRKLRAVRMKLRRMQHRQ